MGHEAPRYLEAYRSGRLASLARKAVESLSRCTLCPRACAADRREGGDGVCMTGRWARVASYGPHFGEEAPLVGRGGSGTIFFSGCNLLCCFCQNHDISHGLEGREMTGEALAATMLELEGMGCHNINLVTPSHVVPQILEALTIAAGLGLSLPLVYNTSGYDRVDTLRLLDGIVDIYMPDFKFWSSGVAEATCNAPDYPEVARRALLEMHRQVGDLVIDTDGVARRGLLIRHLVLPERAAGTADVMAFIARDLSTDSYVNVMGQYRPCFRAWDFPPISRRPTPAEYQDAVEAARSAGLTRLDGPLRFRL